MTQAKHTPGQWIADGTDVCQTVRPDGSKCFHVIAQMSYPLSEGLGEYIEIEKANARIIAAARNAIGDDFMIDELEQYDFGGLTKERDELLEALEERLQNCSTHDADGVENEWARNARAVIAKAKGA